jgi:hypothetical protein
VHAYLTAINFCAYSVGTRENLMASPTHPKRRYSYTPVSNAHESAVRFVVRRDKEEMTSTGNQAIAEKIVKALNEKESRDSGEPVRAVAA